MADMTRHEYWVEVASLAESITEEAWDDGEYDDEDDPSFQGDLSERLWETIDGHQWVIYTAYNFDVLRFSENDGYMVDHFGSDGLVADGALNWGALAFWALCADVQEHSAFGEVPAPEGATDE